jgi:hypothetical protein
VLQSSGNNRVWYLCFDCFWFCCIRFREVRPIISRESLEAGKCFFLSMFLSLIVYVISYDMMVIGLKHFSVGIQKGF